MELKEPHVLLVRGNLETPLEEAVNSFRIPLERIPSKRGKTIKYFTFAKADEGFLLTASQQNDLTNPNIVLAIASPSERRNESIRELFEQQTGAILNIEFPRQVIEYSKKELIYNLKIMQINKKMGMALLRGDVRRDYVEIWEKYHLN
ncbi:MAG: hypothetical protein AABX96_02375 [Nanoarchaeota archaeon]